MLVRRTKLHLWQRIYALVLPVPLILTLAVTYGCKDDPKRPLAEADEPSQPGLGGAGAGSSSADGAVPVDGAILDAGACNTLVNIGAVVDETAVADSLPAGTGGTIVDGTYVLTDAKIYVGQTGQPGLTNATYSGILAISGTAFQRVIVYTSSTSVATEDRSIGSFIADGVAGSFALSCPTSTTEQVTISVANTAVTFGNLTTKETLTFTKQP